MTSAVSSWFRSRREAMKKTRTLRRAVMLGVVAGMIGMVFWLGPGRAVVDAANGSGSSRSLLSGGENTCVDYSDAELEWYWCIVYALVLLYALVGLAVVCDEFFVASLELISERLNLSDDVAGATFMAAGSSAPELFTSVVDTFWSENNVGIGTIVGSAVFNILVIIAVSAAASAHPLHIDWRPLSRDSFFYLISIVLLILFMLPESSAPDGCKEHPGAVSWYESVLLVVWYALYIVFMAYNQTIFAWVDRKLGTAPEKERRASTESVASVNAAMRALQMLQLPPEQREAIKRLENIHKARALLQERNIIPDITPAQRARRRFRSAQIAVRLFVHFRRNHMNSAAPDAAGDATATAAPMNPVLDVEESKAAASDVMVQINDDAGAQVAAVAPGATGGEVHAWLAKLAPPMHQYSARLVDEGFDTLASVRFLTKEDLLHFGIKNGHVRTLLPEINQLRDTWESTHAQRVPLASAGDVEAGAAGPVVVAGVLTPPEAVEDDDEDDEPDTCFGKFIEMLSVPWMWAFKTVPDCSQEKYKSWYIVTFTMSIVWIGIISFILVEMATRLGCAANVSAVLMGLTILAAGTSVPDALGSMVVARQGQGDMAVGNAIGSNVFDICLGLGLPYSAKTIFMNTEISVEGGNVTGPVLILLGTLLVVFVALLVNKWKLTRPIGLVYLVAYAGFVVYNIVVEADKEELPVC